jgi:hypothetical protein
LRPPDRRQHDSLTGRRRCVRMLGSAASTAAATSRPHRPSRHRPRRPSAFSSTNGSVHDPATAAAAATARLTGSGPDLAAATTATSGCDSGCQLPLRAFESRYATAYAAAAAAAAGSRSLPCACVLEPPPPPAYAPEPPPPLLRALTAARLSLDAPLQRLMLALQAAAAGCRRRAGRGHGRGSTARCLGSAPRPHHLARSHAPGRECVYASGKRCAASACAVLASAYTSGDSAASMPHRRIAPSRRLRHAGPAPYPAWPGLAGPRVTVQITYSIVVTMPRAESPCSHRAHNILESPRT